MANASAAGSRSCPAEAAVVARIFENYAADLSPIAIMGRLNAKSVPSPRRSKTSALLHGKAAA